jgi:hypothetical protein
MFERNFKEACLVSRTAILVAIAKTKQIKRSIGIKRKTTSKPKPDLSLRHKEP